MKYHIIIISFLLGFPDVNTTFTKKENHDVGKYIKSIYSSLEKVTNFLGKSSGFDHFKKKKKQPKEEYEYYYPHGYYDELQYLDHQGYAENAQYPFYPDYKHHREYLPYTSGKTSESYEQYD